MAWVNQNFAVGQILTAAQMNTLVANLTAMMNGDSGAPRMRPEAVLSTVAGTSFTSAIDVTVNSVNVTSPTKVNEIRVPYSGSLNVVFELQSVVNGGSTRGQIYVNGSPIGVIRSNNSLGYIPFSENISGLNPGDLVQLFLYKESGSISANSRNFTIRENAPNSDYVINL